MDPALEFHHLQSRRRFFQGAGLKVGGIALAQLLAQRGLAAKPTPSPDIHTALPGLPHFVPKAKNLIYLHMNGAPAQQDLFDHKPQMEKFFDKELPDSVRNGQRITTMTSGQKRFPVAPSRFAFERCGQSGILMSELVPHMKGIADEITMIKSVHTEAINHDPACTFVMTGSEGPGKPSLRFLAQLWPWQRKPESTRLRGFHPDRQEPEPGVVHSHVDQWFPSLQIRWGETPQRR